jgi:hypothetical protein
MRAADRCSAPGQNQFHTRRCGRRLVRHRPIPARPSAGPGRRLQCRRSPGPRAAGPHAWINRSRPQPARRPAPRRRASPSSAHRDARPALAEVRRSSRRSKSSLSVTRTCRVREHARLHVDVGSSAPQTQVLPYAGRPPPRATLPAAGQDAWAAIMPGRSSGRLAADQNDPLTGRGQPAGRHRLEHRLADPRHLATRSCRLRSSLGVGSGLEPGNISW